MAEEEQSLKVLCRGGLDATEDHLRLSDFSPGRATRLMNFEVGARGGYRSIKGYQELNSTNPEVPGEGTILGVIIHDNEIYSARTATGVATYDWHKFVPDGAWTSEHTGLVSTGVSYIRSETYFLNALGAGAGYETTCVTDGVNPAQILRNGTWTALDPALGADLTYAPANPKFSSFHSNHLFLGGHSSNPNQLIVSEILEDTSFDTAGTASVYEFDFEIVAIYPFREELYVFGRNRIAKIIGTNKTTFEKKSVAKNIGCIAEDSVVEINGNLLFLSADGIRPVAGTARIGDVELSPLAPHLTPLTESYINNNDVTNLRSNVITNKAQFRYYFSDDSAALGIIGGLRTEEGSVSYEFSQMYGIGANVATSGVIGNSEYVLHGDHTGKVFKQEETMTFNGLAIIYAYASPYLHAADPQIRKTFNAMSVFLKPEGAASFALSIDYDWGTDAADAPEDYLFETVGTEVSFGDGTLFGDAGAIWGGPTERVIDQPIEGSGRSVRFRLVCNAAEEQFTIQGFVLDYKANGRVF